MRLVFCVVAAAAFLVSCGAGGKTEGKGPLSRYHLHGVIESVDASSKTANIKHDKIEGFMEAMTMDYSVRDAGEFARLRKGETIDATLFAQDDSYWIGEIREVK